MESTDTIQDRDKTRHGHNAVINWKKFKIKSGKYMSFGIIEKYYKQRL